MNKIEDIPTMQFDNSSKGKRIINRDEIFRWLYCNETLANKCAHEMHYLQLEESDKDLFILVNYVFRCVALEKLLFNCENNKPITIVIPKAL